MSYNRQNPPPSPVYESGGIINQGPNENLQSPEEHPLCFVCEEEVEQRDKRVHLNCGHIWCKGCLNQYVSHRLTSRLDWPPRCCNEHGIDMDAVRPSLEDQVVDRLDQVREEFECENPVYCHVSQCSEFIPVRTASDQGRFIRCPKCHELTCVECKTAKEKHTEPHDCPELISKEDKRLAQKEGWKQCPNKRCQKLIERTEGCARIFCECSTHFCFRCGGLVNQLSGTASPCTCRR